MTTLKTQLPTSIRAYSSDPAIRTEARLERIQEFRAKAVDRDAAYICDGLDHGRLFVHELCEDALRDFILFASQFMSPSDMDCWLANKALEALLENAFDKASIILSASSEKIRLDVDLFPIMSTPLLEFLEDNTHLFVLTPFLNMNWDNKAGHEGFLRLQKLVGAPALKKLVMNDFDYKQDDNSYSALGLLAQHGMLDDFLDRETINLLFARGLIQFLSGYPNGHTIRDQAIAFRENQLLEAFACEAKYGNVKYMTYAVQTLLPFITSHSDKP